MRERMKKHHRHKKHKESDHKVVSSSPLDKGKEMYESSEPSSNDIKGTPTNTAEIRIRINNDDVNYFITQNFFKEKSLSDLENDSDYNAWINPPLSPDESVNCNTSETSRAISSFHINLEDLDVPIHKIQESTPEYKEKPKNAPRTYIPPSSVKKSPKIYTIQTNSTSVNKSNSKEQISVVSSKNLLLEFDKSSSFYSKRVNKNNSEAKLETAQTRISPRKQPVVNKIRMFNTKFKSHIEPKKTTIALEDLSRKDDKIKEI